MFEVSSICRLMYSQAIMFLTQLYNSFGNALEGGYLTSDS
mgnify:CR=1 FL=1